VSSALKRGKTHLNGLWDRKPVYEPMTFSQSVRNYVETYPVTVENPKYVISISFEGNVRKCGLYSP
jgi:hypothetical protein